MLLENLKQKLDNFNEEQLKQIAHFINTIESEANVPPVCDRPLLRQKSASERTCEFRYWVSQLPKTHVSLSNTAFSRDRIYQ